MRVLSGVAAAALDEATAIPAAESLGRALRSSEPREHAALTTRAMPATTVPTR